jgi:hypothetical protein
MAACDRRLSLDCQRLSLSGGWLRITQAGTRKYSRARLGCSSIALPQ